MKTKGFALTDNFGKKAIALMLALVMTVLNLQNLAVKAATSADEVVCKTEAQVITQTRKLHDTVSDEQKDQYYPKDNKNHSWTNTLEKFAELVPGTDDTFDITLQVTGDQIQPNPRPVYCVLVVDASGSMTSNYLRVEKNSGFERYSGLPLGYRTSNGSYGYRSEYNASGNNRARDYNQTTPANTPYSYTRLQQVQDAMYLFADTFLKAGEKNYVAVASYGRTGSKDLNWTTNAASLKSTAESFFKPGAANADWPNPTEARGQYTNHQAGFAAAYQYIAAVASDADIMKQDPLFVILYMSDGKSSASLTSATDTRAKLLTAVINNNNSTDINSSTKIHADRAIDAAAAIKAADAVPAIDIFGVSVGKGDVQPSSGGVNDPDYEFIKTISSPNCYFESTSDVGSVQAIYAALAKRFIAPTIAKGSTITDIIGDKFELVSGTSNNVPNWFAGSWIGKMGIDNNMATDGSASVVPYNASNFNVSGKTVTWTIPSDIGLETTASLTIRVKATEACAAASHATSLTNADGFATNTKATLNYNNIVKSGYSKDFAVPYAHVPKMGVGALNVDKLVYTKGYTTGTAISSLTGGEWKDNAAFTEQVDTHALFKITVTNPAASTATVKNIALTDLVDNSVGVTFINENGTTITSPASFELARGASKTFYCYVSISGMQLGDHKNVAKATSGNLTGSDDATFTIGPNKVTVNFIKDKVELAYDDAEMQGVANNQQFWLSISDNFLASTVGTISDNLQLQPGEYSVSESLVAGYKNTSLYFTPAGGTAKIYLVEDGVVKLEKINITTGGTFHAVNEMGVGSATIYKNVFDKDGIDIDDDTVFNVTLWRVTKDAQGDETLVSYGSKDLSESTPASWDKLPNGNYRVVETPKDGYNEVDGVPRDRVQEFSITAANPEFNGEETPIVNTKTSGYNGSFEIQKFAANLTVEFDKVDGQDFNTGTFSPETGTFTFAVTRLDETNLSAISDNYDDVVIDVTDSGKTLDDIYSDFDTIINLAEKTGTFGFGSGTVSNLPDGLYMVTEKDAGGFVQRPIVFYARISDNGETVEYLVDSGDGLVVVDGASATQIVNIKSEVHQLGKIVVTKDSDSSIHEGDTFSFTLYQEQPVTVFGRPVMVYVPIRTSEAISPGQSVEFTGLEMGNYRVVENVNLVYYYQNDSQKQDVTLHEDGQQIVYINVYNKKAVGNIELTKEFFESNGTPLTDIGGSYTFNLTKGQSEEIIVSETISGQDLINGQTVLFEGLKPGINYVITEVIDEVWSGYFETPAVRRLIPVLFDPRDSERIITTPVTMNNYLKPGTVIVHKVAYDIHEKEYPLAGAVFGLFEKTEEGFAPLTYGEGIPFTAISDGNGVATFNNVPLGDWYVKELTAPEFYKLNQFENEEDAYFPVSLYANSETVVLLDEGNTFINEPNDPSVGIDKTINGTHEAGIAVNQDFEVKFTVTNTGGTPLKNLTLTNVVTINGGTPVNEDLITWVEGEMVVAEGLTVPDGFDGTLGVGKAVEFTMTRRVTVTNGSYADTVTVSATPDLAGDYNEVTDEDTAIAENTTLPRINILKYVTVGDTTYPTTGTITVEPGQEFTVTAVVTNTGLVTINNLYVTDVIGDTTVVLANGGSLAPGQSRTYTVGTFTLGNNETHHDAATVTGYDERENRVSSTDTADVTAPYTPPGGGGGGGGGGTYFPPYVYEPAVAPPTIVAGETEPLAPVVVTPPQIVVEQPEPEAEVNIVVEEPEPEAKVNPKTSDVSMTLPFAMTMLNIAGLGAIAILLKKKETE